MPKSFLAVAVLWTAIILPAHAAKVKFGETVVNIPSPDGFAQVGEEPGRLSKVSSVLGDSSPLKAAFVPKTDAAGAGEGLPARAAAVFAIDGPAAGGIGLENFSKLAASPGSKETMDALKAHMATMTAPVIGAPPGSKEQRPVPAQILPPHVSSDRHIALSMKRTGKTIGPGGVPTEHKAAYTTAFVVARGMVIRLVVHSESDGVSWTQETCRAWAEAVIAENPAEPGSAGSFSLDTASEALDGLVASLPLEPVIAKARTVPWLGSLSPTALNVLLGVAALAILLFAMSVILKFVRRIRG